MSRRYRLDGDSSGAAPRRGGLRPPLTIRRVTRRERAAPLARGRGAACSAWPSPPGGLAAVLALRPRPVPVDVAKHGARTAGGGRRGDRQDAREGSLRRLGPHRRAASPGDRSSPGTASMNGRRAGRDRAGCCSAAESPSAAPRRRPGSARRSPRSGRPARRLGARAAAQELAEPGAGARAQEAPPRAPSCRAGNSSRPSSRPACAPRSMSSAVFAEKVAAEEVRRRARRARPGRRPRPRPARRRACPGVRPGAAGSSRRAPAWSPAGAPLIEVGDPERARDGRRSADHGRRPGPAGDEVVDPRAGAATGPLAGRVRLIEPSGFTKLSALGVDEQRVNVVVALTDPQRAWQRWATATASRPAWCSGRRRRPKAPQGAVFRHGDGWAAYRIDGGRAVLVPVRSAIAARPRWSSWAGSLPVHCGGGAPRRSRPPRRARRRPLTRRRTANATENRLTLLANSNCRVTTKVIR